MPDEKNLKRPSLVALTALGILLIGAIVFFKERILFADAAYIIFNIVNRQSLFIQEHRYGSFITQGVPWLGEKLHLSMRALVVAYSVSFNLFYLAVSSLLVFRFRYYGLAILMALYYFLFVSDSYFWTNNEIHQAVAWMFLFFGVTLYMGSRKVKTTLLIPVFLLLATLTFFTHFIVIIPAAFLWVYYILEKESWPFSRKMTGILSSIIVIIIGIKYVITKSGSYDSMHLHNVTHLSLQDIIDSFRKPVIATFCYRCITNYWLAVLIFIAGFYSLIKSKKTILAAWVVFFLVSYFILMGLTFGIIDNSFPLFHIEAEWQSISIIIAAPFVFSVLPKLKPQLSTWLLVAVFMVRIMYISTAIPDFHWRIDFQEKVAAQMSKSNISKLAIYNDSTIHARYIENWAVTYETLLAAAMNEDKPQQTFCFINKESNETQEQLKSTKALYNTWGMFPVSELNRKYFTIDTTQAYTVMTYEQLFSK